MRSFPFVVQPKRESKPSAPPHYPNHITDKISKNIIVNENLSEDEKIELSIKSIQALRKKRRVFW